MLPRLPFDERARVVKQPVAKKLLDIVHAKKTNLCVAIDVTTSSELVRLTQEVAPFVCAVKTHIDALEDFAYDKVNALKSRPELYQTEKLHRVVLTCFRS